MTTAWIKEVMKHTSENGLSDRLWKKAYKFGYILQARKGKH